MRPSSPATPALRAVRAAPVLLALALTACVAPPRVAEEAQVSLVAAERAFAADARERGVRLAFLAHFAPGGLLFVPSPAPVEQVFANPPADPLATLLEWEPVASGVAASGDFGFSIGPSRISRRDGSVAPRHSTFFSVWRRAGDGRWRVVIDAGIVAPAPVEHARLQPSPRVPRAAADADASLARLHDDERGAPWSREAFLARLAPDALALRTGMQPVQGSGPVAAAWPDGEETLQPLGGDVAASRDLAYTYGALRSAAGTGHYVHLWTRDPSGRAWRIAAALRLA